GDDVGPVEGTEERDLEIGGVRVENEVGPPLGLLPAVFGRVEAAVEDAYASVRTQRVLGAHPGQAALEAVVEPGDFVPGAQVAVQVEIRDRRHERLAADATAEQGEQGDEHEAERG